MTQVDTVMRWLPIAIAAVALVYILIRAIGSREQRQPGKDSAPYLVAFVLLLLTAGALARFTTPPLTLIAVGIGGVLMLGAVFAQDRLGGSDGRFAGILGVAVGLLSVGLLQSIQAYTGPNAVAAILCGAAGVWAVGVAFVAVGAGADERAEARRTLAITTMLTAASIASAVALATYRFPARAVSGILYPPLIAAAAIVLGFVVAPIFGRDGRPARGRAIAAVIVFVADMAIAVHLLASRYLHEPKAGNCGLAGLGAAMLVIIISAYRSPSSRTAGLFRTELAVAQTLTVLSAAALSFRWFTGYGVAICAISLLTALAIAYPLAAVRRLQQETEGGAQAWGLTETVQAAGAVLSILALVRLTAETLDMSRVGVDTTGPYPLVGLALGAILPTIVNSSRGRGLGQASLAAEIWLAAVVLTAGLTLIWRAEFAMAFSMGFLIAEVTTMHRLWACDSGATEDAGASAHTSHALCIGGALMVAMLTPKLTELTQTITRHDKIVILLSGLGALFLWTLWIIWRRTRSLAPVSAGK